MMLMMIILAMTDKDRSSRRASREARKYFVISSYLHRIVHTLVSLSLYALLALFLSRFSARSLSPCGARRCCPSLEKEDKCYYAGYIAVEKTGTSLIRTSASFETIGVSSLDTLSFFSFSVFPAAIHSFICFVSNSLDFSRSPASLIDCLFVVRSILKLICRN